MDDNQDAALTLEIMLRALGHETRTVFDGLAAVNAAEEFKPEALPPSRGETADDWQRARCSRGGVPRGL